MNNELRNNNNSKEMNSLKLTLFEGICSFRGIPVVTESIPCNDIPQGIPAVMREFYSQFAPVNIVIEPLNIAFLPYDTVFGFIAKDTEPTFIPVAVYNGSQPIYMDKYPDGSWDKRIQLSTGNGKVQIMGEDIFEFIAKLALRLSRQ